MPKKTGLSDPYATRRSVAFVRRAESVRRCTDGSLPKHKDDAQTNRDLGEIFKEYKAKEFAVATAQGPHSLPAEQHYPKSFFISKKEDEDA